MQNRPAILSCAAAFVTLFAIPTDAHAGFCDGVGQRIVKINSKILIDGQARGGIPVKVGAEAEIIADAFTDDWGGAAGFTNAAGMFSVNMCYSGPGAFFGINPHLIFRFRTDWNGDAITVNGNYDFKDTINLSGAGAKNFVELRPDSKVKFRFPVIDPNLINNIEHLLVRNAFDLIYSGPMYNDHMAPKGSPGGAACFNYKGQGGRVLGVPYCYGGHEGTDYMLVGGFDQMDKPSTNLVLAAADGVVEKIVDTSYDRCHTDLLSSDYSVRINCDGKLPAGAEANHIIIDHGFDHPGDPAYAVKTIYYHIKKGSATSRITKGQFVPCGTVIAEIGSSGISAAPHLHFQVEHYVPNGRQAHADPYQGKLSTKTYWVNQNGGPRGFPSSQCQSPLERYGPSQSNFAANLMVGPPQDFGILATSPVGGQNTGQPRRYWRIVARVASSGLTGFNAQFANVKYTFPKTALVAANPSKVDQDAIFFVPIASARDPALSQYAFDVIAQVNQTSAVATPITRYASKHVVLSRPQINLGMSGVTQSTSIKQCGNQRVYSVNLSAKANGFSGTPVTNWLTTSTGGRKLTSAPTPLTLCAGEGATSTVTMVDAAGVESATESKSFSTPTFVASISAAFARNSPVNTIAIPNGSMLGAAGDKTAKVYGQMRVVVKPEEVGGSPFPAMPPKQPLSMQWKDLTYRDLTDGVWKPIPPEAKLPLARGAPGGLEQPPLANLKKPPPAQKIAYRMDKTVYDNDTVVITFGDLTWPTSFAAAAIVTDGDKRVAADTIQAANGVLPAPDLKDLLVKQRFSDLFLASGFRYEGMPRQDPMLHIPRAGGDPAPPDGLAALVRANTLINRADKAAVIRFSADFTALRHQLDQARVAKTPGSMPARSLPKFSVEPTRLAHTPMMTKLQQLSAAPRAQMLAAPGAGRTAPSAVKPPMAPGAPAPAATPPR